MAQFTFFVILAVQRRAGILVQLMIAYCDSLGFPALLYWPQSNLGVDWARLICNSRQLSIGPDFGPKPHTPRAWLNRFQCAKAMAKC
jgi:hypothetical protein